MMSCATIFILILYAIRHTSHDARRTTQHDTTRHDGTLAQYTTHGALSIIFSITTVAIVHRPLITNRYFALLGTIDIDIDMDAGAGITRGTNINTGTGTGGFGPRFRLGIRYCIALGNLNCIEWNKLKRKEKDNITCNGKRKQKEKVKSEK